MKKLFALLAVALGVVACQKDQADMGVNLGGEQEVMINVSLPDETRADSADGFDLDSLKTDANYQLRYILEIYRDGAEDGKKYRDVKYSDDTSVSFPVRLAPGRAYSIAVWADVVSQTNPGDLYYNTESLKNISINESYWTAMDEKRDAFYGKASLDTDDHVADMSTITLKRPFAKIRVISTDIDAVRKFDLDPTNVSVEYLSELYTSFDAVSGEAVGATTPKKVVTANYDTAKYGDFDTAEATLFADYIFVPANGTIQFAMTVNAAAGVINTASFTTPIPVEVNKVTTIKGDVLTEGGNVSVKIENELGEKETINMVNTAESLQEIINNTQVGESANIALGGDIDLGDLFGGILSTRAAATLPIVIAEGKTLTLDLNGFKITTPFVEGSDTNHAYAFENHGTLTIQDSNGNGQIIARGIFNYGTMTLKSGTINACDGNGGYGVRNYEGAEFIMNGGSIVTSYEDGDTPGNGYDASPVRVDEGATATINGGAINNVSNFTVAIDNYGETTINGGTFTTIHTTIANSATMTINGGSFTCNGLEGVTAHAFWAAAGTATINGGTFDGKDNYNGFNICASKGATVNIKGGEFLPVHSGSLYGEGTIIVTGGEFFDNPSKFVNDDYTVKAENGLWKVVRKSDVAKIGEVGYTSLAKAVAAVKDGETITFVSDITLENIAVLADCENVVLDGNGKTLTSSAGRAINVSGAQNVTIKDLTINASGERAINIIQNSTNITIENVTATAANYTVNVASSAPGAVVAIKNSTLNGLCTVNVASAEAYVTVDGSTVNCNDNNTTAGESYAALCLIKEAVGGKIIATNSTINVTEGSDSTAGRNGAEDGEVTIDGSVDRVVVTYAVITYTGSDYYHGFQTIAAAVEFAKNGDVISLIRNVELTEPLVIAEDDNVVINLNGKTITTNEEQSGRHHYAILNNGTLSLNGNGAINARGIKNFGTMTVDGDLTITNVDTNGGAAIWNEGELTINNGTFISSVDATSGSYGAALNTRAGGKAVVNGGTFEAYSYLTYAIVNEGETTIYDAIVKGKHGAVAGAETNDQTAIYGGSFELMENPGVSDHCTYYVSAIYGGTFSLGNNTDSGAKVFCESKIAEGYKAVEENGVWTVSKQ